MTDKCIYNYTCEVLMDHYSLDASPAKLVKSQTKVNYTKLDSEKLRQSVKILNDSKNLIDYCEVMGKIHKRIGLKRGLNAFFCEKN